MPRAVPGRSDQRCRGKADRRDHRRDRGRRPRKLARRAIVASYRVKRAGRARATGPVAGHSDIGTRFRFEDSRLSPSGRFIFHPSAFIGHVFRGVSHDLKQLRRCFCARGRLPPQLSFAGKRSIELIIVNLLQDTTPTWRGRAAGGRPERACMAEPMSAGNRVPSCHSSGPRARWGACEATRPDLDATGIEAPNRAGRVCVDVDQCLWDGHRWVAASPCHLARRFRPASPDPVRIRERMREQRGVRPLTRLEGGNAQHVAVLETTS